MTKHPSYGAAHRHGVYLRAACLIGAILLTPQTSTAGPGGVGGGSTEWTQIANNLELASLVGIEGDSLNTQAQMLSAELEQVRTQIQTYQTILRNTVKLPDSFLREAMDPVKALRVISSQVSGLARDGASLDSFLRSEAMVDPMFTSQPLDEARVAERYDTWQRQWSGSVEASLRGANLTMQDVAVEGELIDTITSRFGNQEGHMQALQVANELSGSMARQMNQLRAITATQSQQTSVAWGRVLADMDTKEAGQRSFETQINQSLDNAHSQGSGFRSIHEILGIDQ